MTYDLYAIKMWDADFVVKDLMCVNSSLSFLRVLFASGQKIVFLVYNNKIL